MRVAVIGAGASGLVSACHVIQSSCSIDVYEQSSRVGGTWNYCEDPCKDYHSSMYKNLRTNLPKEIMVFEGLDYDVTDVSYLHSETVLAYLNDYANKFDLRKYIKLNTLVLNVSRDNEVWKIVSQNTITKREEEQTYDAVMVCNGHYSIPSIPHYEGSSKFKGKKIHSHSYRVPDTFKGDDVVMIGMGPSGQDLIYDICTTANRVYMSHHFKDCLNNEFPKNAEHRADVEYFTEDSVVFRDGTSEKVSAILYCTGYHYSFPFLDKSCGITVDENYVHPLYKHFISIRHPTMAFIGIPFRTIIFPMFETQVKSFLNVLLKIVDLPSREEMEADTKKLEQKMNEIGEPKKRYHKIVFSVRDYIKDVVSVGDIEPIPEVFLALYERASKQRKENLISYRDEVFTVIDSNSYKLKNVQEIV